MLLIVMWSVLWVSQAYAACCGPHGGTNHQAMNPVMQMQAIVQSEHEGCNDPQEPCCPQVLDERRPIAGVQTATVDESRLAQPVLQQQALRLLFEPYRPGTDRTFESPGPPDRVYLRLQRFLV